LIERKKTKKILTEKILFVLKGQTTMYKDNTSLLHLVIQNLSSYARCRSTHDSPLIAETNE